MGEAKKIELKFIDSKSANRLCKRWHYSGKVAAISQIHIGVFYKGKCEGVMQYGPPIDRRKLLPLVKGTDFYDFLELNRMAFGEKLPKNSESRAISIANRMIKKHYPNIKWIISFADGTQCGHGTIYQAAGFKLIGINKNKTIVKLEDGSVAAKHGTSKKDFNGSVVLPGYQFRYIIFLDKEMEANLTVPIIPYCKIQEIGAKMYKGLRQ